MPSRRPMDNVSFHLFSANEEEFAIQHMSGLSPYWGICFPRLWPHYDRYVFPDRLPPRQLARWQRLYMLFLRKLVCWSDRRPVLKNPHNTGRIALLRRMFPQARFIHIHRNPFDTYRSNMHIAREGHVMQQLQDPDPQTGYEARFLDNYRAMEDAFYAEADRLGPRSVADVSFEDLERDPVGVVRRIYDQLGLEFSPRLEQRLTQYLAGIADYRKNPSRPLPEDIRQRVARTMEPYLRRWGYAAGEA
jgi:hypothetical protein